MRLVSWNCNGKLRDKCAALSALDADIYVIQKCEDPAAYDAYAKAFSAAYLWIGETKHRGLGVFAKDANSIRENSWPSYTLRHFLSVRVNDAFDLLAVWTCKPYIEAYCIYQSIHFDRITEDTVIIGDLNSNPIWDRAHGMRSHTRVVGELARKGLYSAYHSVTGERPGAETTATFYLYRHLDKGYHTDYCFVAPRRLRAFKILENTWTQYADHLPRW
nr:endonuclease/exonuclease/phosphatase family protein [Maliibacterium massiliense]